VRCVTKNTGSFAIAKGSDDAGGILTVAKPPRPGLLIPGFCLP